MNNFFENAENYGKGLIKFCLISTGVIGAGFVLYFFGLSIFKIGALCWTSVFGHSWSIEP